MRRLLFIGGLLFISFVLAFGQDSIAIGKIGEEGELVYPNQAEEGADGNILVAGADEEGADFVDYWLLNKEGKTLVQGRTNTVGLHITQNFIFYGIRNELGGYQFYVQKREGTETQDLTWIIHVGA